MDEPLPLADVLSGPTDGDNVRHVVAREALLDALFQWRKTTELFARINLRTGIGAATLNAIRALDEFASLAGYESRFEVWQALRTVPFVPRKKDLPESALEPTGNRMMDALEEFSKVSSRWSEDVAASNDVFALARDFAIQHKMPWPWLAIELIFEAMTSSFTLVYEVRLNRHRLVEDDQPESVTEVAFEIPKGTPAQEAISMLGHEQARIQAELASARPIPRGRMPRNQVPKIQRNARWYFEAMVARNSISAVAAQAYPGDMSDRRKDVRGGIRSVTKYFEMTPFQFDQHGNICQKPSSPMG